MPACMQGCAWGVLRVRAAGGVLQIAGSSSLADVRELDRAAGLQRASEHPGHRRHGR